MNTETAQEKAARFLSYRFRTEAEVRKHLVSKEYQKAEIDLAIKSLIEYGYIDDCRYCREFFRMAAGKGKGLRWITSKLTSKGIEKDVIDRALSDLSEAEMEGVTVSERQRALEVGRKLILQQQCEGKPLDQRFKNRLGRRLAALGYSADHIYYVLGKITEDGDE